MSAAYATVCHALGLNTKPDPATEIVALKIIEIATRGARSPTEIHFARDGRITREGLVLGLGEVWGKRRAGPAPGRHGWESPPQPARGYRLGAT
jgi:hypothetical protein